MKGGILRGQRRAVKAYTRALSSEDTAIEASNIRITRTYEALGDEIKTFLESVLSLLDNEVAPDEFKNSVKNWLESLAQTYHTSFTQFSTRIISGSYEKLKREFCAVDDLRGGIKLLSKIHDYYTAASKTYKKYNDAEQLDLLYEKISDLAYNFYNQTINSLENNLSSDIFRTTLSEREKLFALYYLEATEIILQFLKLHSTKYSDRAEKWQHKLNESVYDYRNQVCGLEDPLVAKKEVSVKPQKKDSVQEFLNDMKNSRNEVQPRHNSNAAGTGLGSRSRADTNQSFHTALSETPSEMQSTSRRQSTATSSIFDEAPHGEWLNFSKKND